MWLIPSCLYQILVIIMYENISKLLTYLIIPRRRVFLENLTGCLIVKKYPEFYGTRRFIISFTRSNLLLSSHLHLGLPSGLFPSGFPTKILYTPLLSSYILHVPPISSFSIKSPVISKLCH